MIDFKHTPLPSFMAIGDQMSFIHLNNGNTPLGNHALSR